jgi:hypothetical protein
VGQYRRLGVWAFTKNYQLRENPWSMSKSSPIPQTSLRRYADTPIRRHTSPGTPQKKSALHRLELAKATEIYAKPTSSLPSCGPGR